MTVVTIHHAKTNLSRLIADAVSGKEVVIARGKEPMVRLVPVAPKPKRKLGTWKGKITIPDSFFDPMTEEELAEWYDGPIYPQ